MQPESKLKILFWIAYIGLLYGVLNLIGWVFLDGGTVAFLKALSGGVFYAIMERFMNKL